MRGVLLCLALVACNGSTAGGGDVIDAGDDEPPIWRQISVACHPHPPDDSGICVYLDASAD